MKASLITVIPKSNISFLPLRASMGGHSHFLRNIDSPEEEAFKNLLNWTKRHDVRAFGVGSPWSHISGLSYRKHENEERDRYFAGKIDPATVMDRESVENTIQRLNEVARGETLFYLDNETPKQHYGHLWYIGYDYQVPAWHDYDQDRWPVYSDLDTIEDPNPEDPSGGHRRRTYAEVVALQRKAGAIAIWAHPTSWWWTNGQFTTNIAADLIPQLLADGFIDGLTVQGYDAYHKHYQELWFELLDRGYHVPGFAELDITPGPEDQEHILLNFIPGIDRAPKMDEMKASFRTSTHSISSGGHLWLSVDGQSTGATIATGDDVTHFATVKAWPAPGEKEISRVELLGPGGTILECIEHFPGGEIELEIKGNSLGGWIIARTFGENDGDYTNKAQQKVKHCALTNPIYFRGRKDTLPRPVTTNLKIIPQKTVGNKMRIISAAGEVISSGKVPRSETTLNVPASSRLEIDLDDGSVRKLPVYMANRNVRDLMDYLARGHFLKDYPESKPGVVPVEAFRIDEMKEALQTCTFIV